MFITDLKEKKVAILGFGEKEGKATLEYLLKHGVKPTLFDKREWTETSSDLKSYLASKQVNFVFGSGYLEELYGFDVIFRNPAIPFLISKIQEQIQKGAIVSSQTKWFMDHCPALVIGVTGTKGKGTTSALIYEILKEQFKTQENKVYLTGNIGKIQPFEILDNLTKKDVVIYEMSSFQLQDLQQSPQIAVILMTVSEHLDYHNSLKEYWQAKSSISKFQTTSNSCIVNSDYEGSMFVGNFGHAKKYFFSLKKQADCYFDKGIIYLKNKNETYSKISNWKLRGVHNVENLCAGILACSLAGCELHNIEKAVAGFSGLEHRLEFVSVKKGIKFYNDSFSTTPETCIAAINSFNEPLILILGGSSKKSNFQELSKVIAQKSYIKSIVLIGEEATAIKNSLNKFGQTKKINILEGAQTMKEIFAQIQTVAQYGDTVLLSPACASFGMFTNYIDRGQQFKYEVELWGKRI